MEKGSVRMDEKVRVPAPQEIYRHFKGNYYQVVTMARDTESGEPLVIYQALYGEFGIWARTLQNFTEELDPAKYPNALQRRRFERVDRVGDMPAEVEHSDTARPGMMRSWRRNLSLQGARRKKRCIETRLWSSILMRTPTRSGSTFSRRSARG